MPRPPRGRRAAAWAGACLRSNRQEGNQTSKEERGEASRGFEDDGLRRFHCFFALPPASFRRCSATAFTTNGSPSKGRITKIKHTPCSPMSSAAERPGYVSAFVAAQQGRTTSAALSFTNSIDRSSTRALTQADRMRRLLAAGPAALQALSRPAAAGAAAKAAGGPVIERGAGLLLRRPLASTAAPKLTEWLSFEKQTGSSSSSGGGIGNGKQQSAAAKARLAEAGTRRTGAIALKVRKRICGVCGCVYLP